MKVTLLTKMRLLQRRAEREAEMRRTEENYEMVINTGLKATDCGVVSESQLYSGLVMGLVALLLAALILFVGCQDQALAADVDMHRIMIIESSGDRLAHNTRDDSRGLYQITPICLQEFNVFHKSHIQASDLWDEEINTRIAQWYMNKRIPQMLKYYRVSDTVENRIVAYNAGISYLINGKPLPRTTRDYLVKYTTWWEGGAK